MATESPTPIAQIDQSRGGGAKAVPTRRVDLATAGGLLLALGGILGGLVAEGGTLKDVAQLTAALIVLGGTLGACLVTTSPELMLRAARRLKVVFIQTVEPVGPIIEELIGYATKVRKTGIVSLDADLANIPDPFMQKALTLAVDGTDLDEIRKMMELEISVEEHDGEQEAKVYEAAGGYAPTIGIIGAVLGLIQVMKHLENIDEVGKGIAVAFVATVYGVGSANILFLPVAGKIRGEIQAVVRKRELILEGVCSIVEGLNPKIIRAKLEAYQRGETSVARGMKTKEKRSQASAPASTGPSAMGKAS